MRFLLLLISVAGALSAESRTPVLLELFTSEGCVNCPPADALLVKLHEEQPIRNIEVIVLSEHVDYWNRLGWVDRFSSPEMTKRQSWYSMRWPTRVYTPQVIVDGEREASGGDGPYIVELIRQAARRPKGAVKIAFALNEGGGGFRLDATGAPAGEAATVWLAIVEDNLSSEVDQGENAGRALRHVGVVRTLVEVGQTTAGEPSWSGTASVPFGHDWNRAGLRAVAFLQQTASRAVVAIGQAKLTP